MDFLILLIKIVAVTLVIVPIVGTSITALINHYFEKKNEFYIRVAKAAGEVIRKQNTANNED